MSTRKLTISTVSALALMAVAGAALADAETPSVVFQKPTTEGRLEVADKTVPLMRAPQGNPAVLLVQPASIGGVVESKEAATGAAAEPGDAVTKGEGDMIVHGAQLQELAVITSQDEKSRLIDGRRAVFAQKDLDEASAFADVASDLSTEAVAQLEADSEGGDVTAMVTLARHYVLTRDVDRAVPLLNSAADAGDSGAQLGLARLLTSGVVGQASAIDPVGLYQAAAEAGEAEAQFALGQMYRHGNGVDADLDAARGYYEAAANSGHAGARKALKTF